MIGATSIRAVSRGLTTPRRRSRPSGEAGARAPAPTALRAAGVVRQGTDGLGLPRPRGRDPATGQLCQRRGAGGLGAGAWGGREANPRQLPSQWDGARAGTDDVTGHNLICSGFVLVSVCCLSCVNVHCFIVSFCCILRFGFISCSKKRRASLRGRPAYRV